jgi:hypothetical protein
MENEIYILLIERQGFVNLWKMRYIYIDNWKTRLCKSMENEIYILLIERERNNQLLCKSMENEIYILLIERE